MSSPQTQTRILVADDHVLVAEGVEALLRAAGHPVVRVDSAERLLQQVQSGGFSLVISDISMQHSNGLEAMRQLYTTGPQVPFIFLTMHADPWLARDALRAGAMGYVLKSAAGEELLRAVEEVSNGRHYVSPTLAAPVIAGGSCRTPPLTDKQRQILGQVALGLRSKQIAYSLGISVRTVESHKYALMQAFGVHGTIELVRRAHELGLVESATRHF